MDPYRWILADRPQFRQSNTLIKLTGLHIDITDQVSRRSTNSISCPASDWLTELPNRSLIDRLARTCQQTRNRTQVFLLV